MPRIFVAVPVPPKAAAELAALLPPLPGLRPVAPELMHLTLAFVGQLGQERVLDVVDAAAAAARAHAPFEIRMRGIGRFPERGRPRAVWAGTGDGAQAVARLAETLRAELDRRAVAFDPKPLRPHLTLGRVRDGASEADAQAILAAVRAARADGPSFGVASVHVMESRLTAGGPLYSSRAEVPLTGP